jgi:hypothetical protein
VDLPDAERLEAGRQAAEEAQDRHARLRIELVSQTQARAAKLDKALYHGADTTTLNQLADLEAPQLEVRAEIARNTGNTEMLRAVRGVAVTKGLTDLVAKTVALDPDPDTVPAYLERERLGTAGALEARSNVYSPPPITGQQLQPSSIEKQRWQNIKASQERSATRIMEGRPGLTDVDFYSQGRRVGRRTS